MTHFSVKVERQASHEKSGLLSFLDIFKGSCMEQ